MTDPHHQPIMGIMLAAGRSSRMGSPKQLVEWQGRPLVRAVAENALAARLDGLVVVTGGAHAEVERALHGLALHVVHNPHYAAGQSTSLQAGVAALPPGTAATLILLGDQPFVGAGIIDTLLAAWRAGDALIVAPSYRGRRGNPVLFARALFPELLAITGDQGARELLQRRAADLRLVEFDDDRPLIDIDTPDDYSHAQRRMNSSL